MQLVRLNISGDEGLVKIEIVADGTLDGARIDRFSRGQETVFRVHGVRSLLRRSYQIEDMPSNGVRTMAGESEGEPYVDVLISIEDGATVGQKKSFNRLVIGVSSDFTRVRQRPEPNVAVGGTKSEADVARASIASIRVTDSTSSSTASSQPGRASQSVDQPRLIAMAAPVFRGHSVWGSVPTPTFYFSRSNSAGFVPSFFAPQTATAAQPVSAGFFSMALEPPGARQGVWVPGTTASDRDETGGLALGAGILRPSISLGATYDDNFFYRSPTERNLGIFTFAPRLEYEVPGVSRAARIAYEGKLRRLSNGNWANSHTVDFDSRFDITPFLRLSLRDHFMRSPFDPREYDPAGEVYIVGDTFNRNDGGLRVEYKLSDRNRIALDGAYNMVRWSDDHIAGAPLFINYDELSPGIAFERDISEDTTALVNFSFTNTLSSVPLRPQFDGLNDSQRYVFEIGLRKRMSESGGLAAKVGYERNVFRNAPTANDFDGLVFDLRFRGDLTPKTNFQLAALRKTQVSAFNLEGGNARLLSTGANARVETAQTENLSLSLGVNYQQLGFPQAIVANSTASGGVFVGQFAGERRKDHLYGASVEAAYRWSELMKTRLVYSFSRRDSTIPVFTFNRNRISLVFEIGRRNNTKGRPF
ncbi:MAG: hypothetical protein QOJ64_4535 [Acidobacteriota bacterium]|jgi:hypothetical protein|nr:hypothetical protein [Acidobacteriota bacterium]